MMACASRSMGQRSAAPAAAPGGRAAAGRVDHAPDERVAHRHVGDAPGAPRLVAGPERPAVAEQDDADLVAVQVERHAEHAAGELDQLLGAHARQARQPRRAVAHGAHRAHLADLEPGTMRLDDARQSRVHRRSSSARGRRHVGHRRGLLSVGAERLGRARPRAIRGSRRAPTPP
jgi:hypothetical protein